MVAMKMSFVIYIHNYMHDDNSHHEGMCILLVLPSHWWNIHPNPTGPLTQAENTAGFTDEETSRQSEQIQVCVTRSTTNHIHIYIYIYIIIIPYTWVNKYNFL